MQNATIGAARRGSKRRLATARAVVALMLREIATRYGRSPGGYVWALLEHLGTIAILAVGFSIVVRSPALGNSFLLFFATGFLPFNLYQSVSVTVSKSVEFSRPLLMYPAVTWADAVLARFFLNALTGVTASLLLTAGILGATDSRVVVDMPPLLLASGLALLLALGVGLLNCVLCGLFPVWAQIWSILTRPLFLISGVFFVLEDLPRAAQNLLWWNPLIHVAGLLRRGIYPTYAADYVHVAYVAGVGLVCLFCGAVLMGRFHRTILSN